MLRWFGSMFLVWDECKKCLCPLSEGEAPIPFLPWYLYRRLEKRKVSFASEAAKEDSKRRTDIFFHLWTLTKEMNSGTHSAQAVCIPPVFTCQNNLIATD